MLTVNVFDETSWSDLADSVKTINKLGEHPSFEKFLLLGVDLNVKATMLHVQKVDQIIPELLRLAPDDQEFASFVGFLWEIVQGGGRKVKFRYRFSFHTLSV